MICSYYDLEAYDKDGNALIKTLVFSFDEANYWTDQIREEYPSAVKFILKFPDKDVYGEAKRKRCTKQGKDNDS